MSEMSLILLVFLQMSATALGEINITQNPTILDTLKGDSAGISCHWNSEDDQQVRVQWRKYISSTEEENGTELCSLRTKKNNYSEVRNNKTSCNVANNTAQLTIYSVTEDDGGLYVCQVIIEIPILRKAKGSGTRLNVRHNDNNGVSGQWKHMAFALVILPFVALLAYFLCKRKKKKCKRISQNKKQEHVQLRQIHQDVAEVEEDSNSSNSVTWAVSTLYESFDYFAIRNPNDKAAASSTSNLAKPETTEESSLTEM
ncbi:uncharacterized protein [Dendropsophus ebraccatus]|uniref:uncharacterized protein n=1 Tax=Dendropsophus ebraccatus TaxID=150705 RepID=UPI0038313FFB